MTPLMFAARYGGSCSARTVEVLLALPAGRVSCGATDFFGASVLHHAASNLDCDLSIITTLLREEHLGAAAVNLPQWPRSLTSRALMALCRGLVRTIGATDSLKRHFAAMAGATPLHNAALRGDSQLCQLLLDARADPTLENALGLTPLQAAAWQGHNGRLQGRVPEALAAALPASVADERPESLLQCPFCVASRARSYS